MPNMYMCKNIAPMTMYNLYKHLSCFEEQILNTFH